MAAYYLFDNVEVNDHAALARYFPQAAKLVAEHGGRYLAVDAAPEVVEGDPGLRSVVLMEFPTPTAPEPGTSRPPTAHSRRPATTRRETTPC